MPPFQKENYTIIQQIQKAEDAIRACYSRVENLEKQLKKNQLHPTQQESIRMELVEVKKLLATNEKNLKLLHKQNIKSFAFAAAFFFICFVVYMLYVLVFGPQDS